MVSTKPLAGNRSLRRHWNNQLPISPSILDSLRNWPLKDVFARAPHTLSRLSLALCALVQVAGERYVYKFVCDPDALFSMAFPDNQRPFLKAESECPLNDEDTLPLTHFEDNPAYLLDMDRCSSLPYAEGFAY